jgi:hypothetical protein
VGYVNACLDACYIHFICFCVCYVKINVFFLVGCSTIGWLIFYYNGKNKGCIASADKRKKQDDDKEVKW